VPTQKLWGEEVILLSFRESKKKKRNSMIGGGSIGGRGGAGKSVRGRAILKLGMRCHLKILREEMRKEEMIGRRGMTDRGGGGMAKQKGDTIICEARK